MLQLIKNGASAVYFQFATMNRQSGAAQLNAPTHGLNSNMAINYS